MSNVKFDIVKEIGVITKGKGWDTRIDLISWNGGEPKYNIRNMSEDLTRAGKGIALTREELNELFTICRENGLIDSESIEDESIESIGMENLIDYYNEI